MRFVYNRPSGKSLHREVFEDSDGEIKRLEEEAAVDPSAKINLIRYLQVWGEQSLRGRGT